MKIQTKILLLLTLIIAMFIGGLYLWRQADLQRYATLFAEIKQDKNTNFGKILELKSTPLQALAFDYSFWDEMVDFVNTGNPQFAIDNLETALSTYKVNSLWVLRLDYSRVYSINDLESEKLKEFPLSKEELASIFAKNLFPHFYVQTDQGLMEIRGAPVQPSADTKRETPPLGYFITGLLWNQEALEELSNITETSVEIISIKEKLSAATADQSAAGVIAFARTLPDFQGNPLMRMQVTSESPVLKLLNSSSRQAFLMLAAFAVALLIVISLAFFTWVRNPLQLISSSLMLEDPNLLAEMQRQPDEFGQLAKLIFNFFAQRRELEEARKKADQASSAKSKFVATISHEIRTPMNGILGFTQLLRKTALDETQSRYLTAITLSGDHLLNLINQILDLARIEAGKVLREPVAFEPRPLVQEALEMIKPQADGKGLALQAAVASEVPAGIFADRKKLLQVVINLLGNAVKFTEHGKVEIRIGMDGERILVLQVQDSGPGIPKEKQEKIFNAFEQLDYGLNRTHEGTGLGLTISAKFIEVMGGKIALESVLGQGSTFIVKLPVEKVEVGVEQKPPVAAGTGEAAGIKVAPAAREVPAKALAAGKDREKPLILVAEDFALNREMVKEMLITNGYRVAEVENGSECLEFLKKQRPDLLLLDMAMPVMDGLEVAKRIRQSHDLKNLPLIALTASAMSGDRERCLEAGFDDYLTKPFLCEDLVEMIEKTRKSGSS